MLRSPQGPVIGCEADTSASSTVGVPVAATATKIGPTSAVQARPILLSKEQAWPKDPQNGLSILATQAAVGVAIDCLSSSISRENLGYIICESKDLGHPREDLRCQIGSFFSVVVPPKPLRFKLSYQKTSSQDSGNVPVIGLCSAIDQQFTVPTGQIVAAADRNNRGSPWERRLFAVGSEWLGVSVWE